MAGYAAARLDGLLTKAGDGKIQRDGLRRQRIAGYGVQGQIGRRHRGRARPLGLQKEHHDQEASVVWCGSSSDMAGQGRLSHVQVPRLILGAGWPFFNGGICRYLDQTGLSKELFGRPFVTADDGARHVPA